MYLVAHSGITSPWLCHFAGKHHNVFNLRFTSKIGDSYEFSRPLEYWFNRLSAVVIDNVASCSSMLLVIRC